MNELRPASDNEIRLRVAGACADRVQVERLMNEVTALYTNGPAGGGGVRKSY